MKKSITWLYAKDYFREKKNYTTREQEVCFDLLAFYSISDIVGNFMPNPPPLSLYIYIYILFVNTFVDKINEPKLIFHTVK